MTNTIKNKRKIIVSEWITLDGYISGPENSLNWILGDDELGDYELDLMGKADALLLGRTTYDMLGSYWPNVPNNPNAIEFDKKQARLLNAAQKIVFSKTMKNGDWKETTIIQDLTPEAVEKLKEQPGKDIVIYGSSTIVQQLTEMGLVDEYQLLVHPTILGEGKQLFKGGVHAKLQLVDVKKFRSGVTVLTYSPKS
jgi:dihydrofolate reductase